MKCSCGHTFKFELARVRDMKIRMHEKFCDKQANTKFASQTRKAVMPKDTQHMNVRGGNFVVRT